MYSVSTRWEEQRRGLQRSQRGGCCRFAFFSPCGRTAAEATEHLQSERSCSRGQLEAGVGRRAAEVVAAGWGSCSAVMWAAQSGNGAACAASMRCSAQVDGSWAQCARQEGAAGGAVQCGAVPGYGTVQYSNTRSALRCAAVR